MSKNNQYLVKEYQGRFYVFDVMAESWGGYDEMPDNTLEVAEAKGVFDTRDKAHKFAHKLDSEGEYSSSEYGVVDEVLYKNGAEVFIRETIK